MRDAVFGLVAHVGDSEGFSFHFSISTVDGNLSLLSQGADETREVDIEVVSDAGQRLGGILFFGKKLKPLSATQS